MLRTILAIDLVAPLLFVTPALAVTAKEKQATCKIGADHEKLTGKARNTFMAKCMANAPAQGAKKKP
jgi:hypothetical protein